MELRFGHMGSQAEHDRSGDDCDLLDSGSIYGQMPSYLCERFPTEVRATASGFINHQGAVWGGLVAPVLTYLAVQMNFGFAIPIMISTILFLILVVISVLLGPETSARR